MSPIPSFILAPAKKRKKEEDMRHWVPSGEEKMGARQRGWREDEKVEIDLISTCRVRPPNSWHGVCRVHLGYDNP